MILGFVLIKELGELEGEVQVLAGMVLVGEPFCASHGNHARPNYF